MTESIIIQFIVLLLLHTSALCMHSCIVLYCIASQALPFAAWQYIVYYTVVDPSLTPILPELFVSTLRFAQSVRYFYPFSVKLTSSWHLHMHYRIFCVANKDSINLVHICGHMHTSVNLWQRNKR